MFLLIFAHLILVVSSQFAPKVDGTVPQCECVPSPSGNGCLQYDSRFQAATLQEAMSSFPDLSISRDNPAPTIESQTSCFSKECQDCNQDLTTRLIEVGLLPLDPEQPPIKNTNSTCTKYSFSLNDQPKKKKRGGSHEDSGEEERRHKRQAPTVIGQRYSLSCSSKGAVTDSIGLVSLCSSCWVWRKLPDTYEPQYINELICDSTDTRCLSDYASCSIGFRSIDVIQTVGSQRVTVSVAAGNYCECRKGSSILPLVTGEASLNLVTPIGKI